MTLKRSKSRRGKPVPLFKLGLLLVGTHVTLAQLSGPPAGVPVPPVTTPAAAPNAAGVPISPDATVFRVRVLDGRNGMPLENAHVKLWYDEAGSGGYTLTTASNGTALMPEPVGVPLRVLLAPEDKIDCRKSASGDAAPAYNLQQIAEKGVALPNTCGPVSAKPHPGELVYFLRAPRWYEGINRP